MHAQTHYFSKRVNWIGAITNIQLQKYIITIRLFKVMPLQFSLYLRCGILYVLHAFGSTYRYFGMDKILLTHLFSPLTYVWGHSHLLPPPFLPSSDDAELQPSLARSLLSPSLFSCRHAPARPRACLAPPRFCRPQAHPDALRPSPISHTSSFVAWPRARFPPPCPRPALRLRASGGATLSAGLARAQLRRLDSRTFTAVTF